MDVTHCTTFAIVHDNQQAAAAAGALEVAVSAMRTHASSLVLQFCACGALGALVADMPLSQTRAGELGGVEAVVAALRECPVPPSESMGFFQRWCTTMAQLVMDHPSNTHAAVTAGVIELLVAHISAPEAHPLLFERACFVLICLGDNGHEERAVLAGAVEALGMQAVEDPHVETCRTELIQRLQHAAQRHDAAQCAVAGCKRCAAARMRGVMCALPGCGARRRDGADAKKLLRCGTCRAACYCSAAHQREDWRRHKRECGAPPRDGDDQAAGASGR
jgi:hypothetical protein